MIPILAALMSFQKHCFSYIPTSLLEMQPSNAMCVTGLFLTSASLRRRTFTRIPSHLVSLEGGDVPFSYPELLTTEYKRRPAFTDTISSPTKLLSLKAQPNPKAG
ncbi:hypothetical protein H109_00251 [Trichophyton interdigitale MR816]|uniref:Uncharacterized protein n=1 Tax=Trichophyton interdigitale (strain MR816) TaxID=1215338 RepID=A0A059JKH3_TRIIM|nr:hypothetical protein H109_00251 [Trichophyton interdigitale MR816]